MVSDSTLATAIHSDDKWYLTMVIDGDFSHTRVVVLENT